ncbi:hypothetical protein RJ641_021066 [Dillenia turbinata]|uniref:F-box associated domain-containing protein n=1 Tax=Dillenia turbinata TaxID=194707 RepID=A0AAN8UE35_9MAGN
MVLVWNWKRKGNKVAWLDQDKKLTVGRSLASAATTCVHALERKKKDESQSCGLSFPFFAFLDSPSVEVMNSCNGLVLLCSSLTTTFYYLILLNHPTSKLYACGTQKCITKWNVGFSMMGTYQIEIFSSKTNLWCVSSLCFTALVGIQFHHGVFWNGTVYWFTPKDWLLSYDGENDLLKSIATPPMDYRQCGNFPYLGVSKGRLHLVYIHVPNNFEFDVLEMERDNSGWATRYRVNIENVATTFPESVIYIPGLPKRLKIFAYTVLSVVRGDKEEELMVVLSIMGKIISYDAKNKTSKLLCDVKKALGHWKAECNGLYAHPFIESLSWV